MANNPFDFKGRAALVTGCEFPAHFQTLSFLALPVIPTLKITDRGLIDVE
jgi:adenine deaminase